MLTIEDLKKVPQLSALTDDQFSAIATLSKNDEQKVIDEKTGKWAQQIEDDFLQASGISKQSGERYFNYIKRGVKELKDKIDAAGDATTLQQEIETLKNQLKEKDKGDPASKATIQRLEQELADEKQRTTELQTSLTTAQSEHENALAQANNALIEYQFSQDWNAALKGMNPVDGMRKETFDELMASRMSAARSKYKLSPEAVSGSDAKVIRLRDESGAIVNNPADLNNPMTVKALALQTMKDILAPVDGDGNKGGGVKPFDPATGAAAGSNGQTGIGFRVTSTNRVGASKEIEKYLLDSGISTRHKDYQSSYKKLYDDNKVNELPLMDRS